MTAPSAPLLFDTDVLIDYLRGRTEAVDYIDNLSVPLFLSVITLAELYIESLIVMRCQLLTFYAILPALLLLEPWKPRLGCAASFCIPLAGD